MKKQLRAGASLVEISPGPGIELAGYPHHPRYNTGIHDPLYAGCIYLDDGRTKLAIISMDLVMYSKQAVRSVRNDIGNLTDIPPENIMITCSHTHSGPWASGMLDLEALEQGRKADEGYLAELHDKLVSLVKTAYDTSFEAKIGIEKGFCGREQGVGGNRRNPYEVADPEVWTIGVEDLQGNRKACLVKYALHPTFLHSDNFLVSADYPGYMRKYFAKTQPDMIFLFAQGTSGNQSPRYFRSGKTFEEAERVGSAIAAEADRVLSEMEFSSEVKLLVASEEVDIDLRTLPSRLETENLVDKMRKVWEEAKALNASERDAWNAELKLLGAEDTLGYVLMQERGEKLELLEDEIPVEVQVIGIGDTRIVGIQGEIFVEFGLTIQYRAPFNKTFAIELANGCLPGYACTEKAYAQGGYETGASLLTGKTGEQLVEAAVKLLHKTQ
ncbi:MAG: hypothetical protein GY801_23660 [bacterium]|nr:hypothetical protein [bacterium]